MNMPPESLKLVELRSKTDRQLGKLIARTLDGASASAESGDFDGRAERACEEVRRLLPWLPRADRRRFEARLEEVAEMLRPDTQAACF